MQTRESRTGRESSDARLSKNTFGDISIMKAEGDNEIKNKMKLSLSVGYSSPVRSRQQED